MPVNARYESYEIQFGVRKDIKNTFVLYFSQKERKKNIVLY